VFWARTELLTRLVELFVVTTLPDDASQGRRDKVLASFRMVQEALFPYSQGERLEREQRLKQKMDSPEMQKEFTVTAQKAPRD
jgi:hypothetical protein